MSVEYAIKPSAAMQMDYSERRHQPEKDDLELSASGLTWLASIEQSARPIRLAAAFPRIVNRIVKIWKTPREMDRYFEDLLEDTRGNRQGFPLNILMELSTLKDYYQAKVFPTRRSAWDS